MDVATAARVVDAHVGPILSSAGFADATLGPDQDRMQILYCADTQMIVRNCPACLMATTVRLPQGPVST